VHRPVNLARPKDGVLEREVGDDGLSFVQLALDADDGVDVAVHGAFRMIPTLDGLLRRRGQRLSTERAILCLQMSRLVLGFGNLALVLEEIVAIRQRLGAHWPRDATRSAR
jgi:hypothetical protein